MNVEKAGNGKTEAEKLALRETARTLIKQGDWEIDGKSASLKISGDNATDVAAAVTAELQRHVTGWTPRNEELAEDTCKVTTKASYLKAAQEAVARQKS